MIDHHVQTTEDKSLAWYPSPEHTEWYSEKVPWFPDSQVDVRNQLGHRPWKDKKKKPSHQELSIVIWLITLWLDFNWVITDLIFRRSPIPVSSVHTYSFWEKKETGLKL